MTDVHVVVPDGIDDPLRPSGGNVYDRRVCRGLAAIGWSVHEHPAAGRWPWADAAARAGLAEVLSGVPRGGLVLLDGLVASATPEVLARQADRLRLVVLMHMPLGEKASPDGVLDARAAERAALFAADAVVTTSKWTRQRLHDLYAMPAGRVHVVEPGVERVDLAPGTAAGGELLCVAAVTSSKGHDVLITALARVRDLPWRCVCVGSLDLEPDFVDHLRSRAERFDVTDRVHFTGPLTGTDLGDAYAQADVLVLPSLAETYAMVVTEALARGLPVVATRVGGVPEALGRSADGAAPGVLVPSGNARDLADALRCWLTDTGRRHRLRNAAQRRRLTLPDWWKTSLLMSRILTEVIG
ncbi:MAG: glycosyltransferase [Pseudonocardiaceae bacterium]|nr:glycosyltransferase [Pseudonocardiaceae bacterium]